jgi:hypothetical protein
MFHWYDFGGYFLGKGDRSACKTVIRPLFLENAHLALEP